LEYKSKGRSVTRPLTNNIQNTKLFQKLRVKLRVVFLKEIVGKYNVLINKGRSVARPPQSRAYLIRLGSEC